MDGDLSRFAFVRRTRFFFWTSLWSRCAWRAIRRSPEHADFWRWLIAYRWQSRPILIEAIANHAVKADLHVFRNPLGHSRASLQA